MSQVEDQPALPGEGPLKASKPVLKEQWLSSPPLVRARVVQQRIRAMLSEVLGMDGADIGAEVGLWDIGLDSLLTVELAEKLSSEMGQTVRPFALLASANINEMTRTLEEMLQAEFKANEALPDNGVDASSKKATNGNGVSTEEPNDDGPSEAQLVRLLDALEMEGL
ncbi:MAG: acyl carrier protein [Myxococcota bacterium]